MTGLKLGAARLFVVFAVAIIASVSFSETAYAQTRSLKLHFTHTKERANIVYKKNGRYVSSGLKKINHLLRDWRRNEPTKMDPKLLDLLWEAYRMTGSREYIHVVSAYRSPATNAMLRRTRGGQATKSQHTLGKAIDFYIPGVPVKKLREIGFKLGGGGVGYYPKSGVPFVHLDTGNVRAWPRMSRRELTRLFPRGDTMHIPPDGRRLPGYEVALARYKARQRGESTIVNDERPQRRGLLAGLFGGADEADDNALAAAPRPQPAPNRPASAVPTPAPVTQPPETPGTLLAALPASALPRPSIAPRARPVEGSVPVAITTAPVTPVAVAAVDQDAATVAPEAAPVEPEAVAAAPAPIIEFEPPIPTRRPAVLIARADAPDERRTASEIEESIALSAAAETLTATVADADAATDGNTAIAAATQAPLETATTELAYALPIPASAPIRPTAQNQQPEQVAQIPTPEAVVPRTETAAPAPVDVAYAPESRGIDIELPVPATRVEPATASAPAAQKAGRIAPATIPTRPTDGTLTAALFTEGGAATTPKTARPRATDRLPTTPQKRPAIVPVDQIDPARFGSWTTTNASVTASGRAQTRPDFIQNATRVAPDVVYTAGFTKAPPPDSSRFSGNAVTFLAVAKFDNGVGNGGAGAGEPLQVSIPN